MPIYLGGYFLKMTLTNQKRQNLFFTIQRLKYVYFLLFNKY